MTFAATTIAYCYIAGLQYFKWHASQHVVFTISYFILPLAITFNHSKTIHKRVQAPVKYISTKLKKNENTKHHNSFQHQIHGKSALRNIAIYPPPNVRTTKEVHIIFPLMNRTTLQPQSQTRRNWAAFTSQPSNIVKKKRPKRKVSYVQNSFTDKDNLYSNFYPLHFFGNPNFHTLTMSPSENVSPRTKRLENSFASH